MRVWTIGAGIVVALVLALWDPYTFSGMDILAMLVLLASAGAAMLIREEQ